MEIIQPQGQTDRERGAALYVQEAIAIVDEIAAGKPQGYADNHKNYLRGRKETRPMTMADAKRLAAHAAMRLRKAWDILDPSA